MGFMTDNIITIILVAGISVGMVSFFFELSDNYSSTVTAPLTTYEKKLLEDINKTTRIGEKVTAPLQEKLVDASEKNIAENIIGFFVGSVVSAGLLLVSIPEAITTFISVLLAPFGGLMPTWVFNTLNTTIAFLFVIIIIRLVMKWKL